MFWGPGYISVNGKRRSVFPLIRGSVIQGFSYSVRAEGAVETRDSPYSFD